MANETMMTVAAVGALAVAGAALTLALRSMRRRRAAPTDGPGPGEEAAGGDQAGKRRLARLGAVLRPQDAADLEALQDRLSRAGVQSQDAIELYLSIRVGFMVGGLVALVAGLQLVSGLIPSVVLAMILAIVAITGPGAWLDLRTRRRQTSIARNLPGMLDLLVTCLDAGLNLEQALARVSSRAGRDDEIMASEIRTTLDEIRAGLAVDLAFRRLAARVGHSDVQNLAALIAQATCLGANLGDALREHARTMRHHRMVFLEEQAGKANAKLTLPLTICLLPSVLVLLLGPAVLMILRSF